MWVTWMLDDLALNLGALERVVIVLLLAPSDRETFFKVAVCGSDAFVNCFMRHSLEGFANRRSKENVLHRFRVPVGRAC